MKELGYVLFWNARDLERKLTDFQSYCNAAGSHASLAGNTPSGVTVEAPSPVPNSTVCVGSLTVEGWSSSQWRRDHEFETDRPGGRPI